MHATSTDRLLFSDRSSDSTWSLYIAGDCVYSESERTDPIGEAVQSRMTGADISMLNLEAPIPADDSIPKFGPRKESDDTVPAMLGDAGIDAVTLANNHAMDYGPTGLFTTIEACHDTGLDTVGAGSRVQEALSPLCYTVDDTDVAIINLCEREFGIATDSPGVGWIGHPEARRIVERTVENADTVVLLAHGGVEFVPLPPIQWQRRLRRFVDLGVDLVVAHHPHVPQGWESYRGTPIFYSLGNFLFGHTTRPKATWGLSVEIEFDGERPVAADLIPTEESDGGVHIMTDDSRREDCLDHLHRLADLTSDSDAMEVHWQELATVLFHQRYAGWLRRSAGSTPLTLLKHPRRYLGRKAFWDGNARQEELLLLLNLFRNSSHRSVIGTALAVETGDAPDRRTPEIEARVRELLSWTEDRPVYERPSALRRKANSFLEFIAPD